MKTNTIARLPADRAPRMIDLTRSLRLPHGSLTPGVDPDPEPRWRRDARQAADETSPLAAWLFLAFISVSAAIIGYYLIAY